MNEYLLTDFSLPRWGDTDMNHVKNLIQRITNVDNLHGEINHPPRKHVPANKASHRISNIRVDGKKVFGQVTFLESKTGQMGKRLVEEENHRFSIRAAGSRSSRLDEIFTWDIVAS